MPSTIIRCRFIPFRKADIVDMCIGDERLSDFEKKKMRIFFRILEEILVKSKSMDVTLDIFGLVWMPYRKDARGVLSPE